MHQALRNLNRAVFQQPGKLVDQLWVGQAFGSLPGVQQLRRNGDQVDRSHGLSGHLVKGKSTLHAFDEGVEKDVLSYI